MKTLKLVSIVFVVGSFIVFAYSQYESIDPINSSIYTVDITSEKIARAISIDRINVNEDNKSDIEKVEINKTVITDNNNTAILRENSTEVDKTDPFGLSASFPGIDPNSIYISSQMRYGYLDNSPKIMKDLDNAIGLDDKNEVKAIFMDLYNSEKKSDYHLVQSFESKEKGLEFMTKALEVLPDSKLIVDTYVLSHKILGEEPAAITTLEKLSGENPESVQVAIALGELYYSSGNIENLTKAQKYYQKAIQLEPDNMVSLSSLANSYRYSGNREMVVKTYKDYLDSASKKIGNKDIISTEKVDHVKLQLVRAYHGNGNDSQAWEILASLENSTIDKRRLSQTINWMNGYSVGMQNQTEDRYPPSK